MLIKKKNIGNVCKSLIWNKNVVLFYVFKGVFFFGFYLNFWGRFVSFFFIFIKIYIKFF